MMRQEIIDRVNDVMHQGFEIPREDLKPEASLFSDLGLDSLDAIDMVVHLEDKMGIKVEGERFQNVRTLEDVYGLVAELISGPAHPQTQMGELQPTV